MGGKDPWYANIVNFLFAYEIPTQFSRHQVDKLKSESKYYVWDDPLWHMCNDHIIRRCVPDYEFSSVLRFCHTLACGGHFGPQRTSRKVLDSGLYWPLYFMMYMIIVKVVHVANKLETLIERMKYLNNHYYFVKSLIFGVLILWVFFHVLLVLYIFF